MSDSYWAKPQTPRSQMFLFSPRLDDALAPDDEIRLFDELLNEFDWSAWENRYERRRGQPPIHPRLVAGAIVFGLSRRILSSRDLEESTSHRIDLIWFLEGRTVDHSTFCAFRRRFADCLPAFFDEVAKKAADARDSGRDVAVDGTRMRANSDRHGSRTAASLRRRLSDVAERKDELLEEMDRLDGIDNAEATSQAGQGDAKDATGAGQDSQPTPDQTKAEPDAPATDEAGDSGQAESVGKDAVPDGLDEPSADRSEDRAALELELAAVQSERNTLAAALERADERDAAKREGEGASATPVRVPVTDPDAHLLPNKEGGFAPNYTPTVAVDMATGAILDAQVPDGADEAGTLGQVVEAVEQRLGHKPENLVCDGNFATGANLEQLESIGVALCSPSGPAVAPAAQRDDPSQPVDQSRWDLLPTTGRGAKRRLAREAFVYDQDQDCYRCPCGRALERVGQEQRKDKTGRTYDRWRYQSSDCSDCPLAQRCLSGRAKTRSVVRDQYQPYRDRQAARMAEPSSRTLYKKRAPIAEGVFGYIKHAMGAPAIPDPGPAVGRERVAMDLRGLQRRQDPPATPEPGGRGPKRARRIAQPGPGTAKSDRKWRLRSSDCLGAHLAPAGQLGRGVAEQAAGRVNRQALNGWAILSRPSGTRRPL